MKKGYQITSSPENATRDLRLIAAITSMGVPLGTPPCMPIVDAQGRERWQFWMGTHTVDGKYSTKQLIGFWHDENFITNNPEHPFAYIRASLQNHKNLSEAVKGIRPLAQIIKGRSVALIHVDAPEKTQELILGGLR